MDDQIKVIIIDDEELVCDMLKSYLEDFGMTVKNAATGKEALSLISIERFDKAIVDMRLPDMIGEELILKMKSLQPQIDFFIHTGSLDYRLSEDLIGIGLTENSIFHKPVNDMISIYKKISGKKENT